MIENYLNRKYLKSPIVKCNSICAFTGKKITEGVLKSKLISKTFTDFELIKYNSDYVSVDIALLLSNVITNAKGNMTSLRNYSFFANKDGFKTLMRDEILDLLLNLKDSEFQICITFSNKKHIAYKSKPQINNQIFTITTDVGNCIFNVKKTKEILPILQNWYKIIKGNSSKQEPTYFTKSDIAGTTIPNFKKIKNYGVAKYFEETKKIEKYRDTLYFKLLIHILNKTN